MLSSVPLLSLFSLLFPLVLHLESNGRGGFFYKTAFGSPVWKSPRYKTLSLWDNRLIFWVVIYLSYVGLIFCSINSWHVCWKHKRIKLYLTRDVNNASLQYRPTRQLIDRVFFNSRIYSHKLKTAHAFQACLTSHVHSQSGIKYRLTAGTSEEVGWAQFNLVTPT